MALLLSRPRRPNLYRTLEIVGQIDLTLLDLTVLDLAVLDMAVHDLAIHNLQS